MTRLATGARRLVRPKRGGSGAGVLVAGLAAMAGVGLIAASNRKKPAAGEYERLGADQLPAVGDFERELEALGGSDEAAPEGEAPRLETGADGIGIEVIDTTAEPVPVVS